MSLREGTAGDALPVSGSSSNGRDRRALGRPMDWPTSLGDPDPGTGLDRVDHVACSLNTLPEDVVAVFPLCRLKVRVTICPDKVAGFNHDLVGRIDPCGPSINMSDLDLASPDRPKHASHVVDLVGEGLRVGVLTVKVLTAD